MSKIIEIDATHIERLGNYDKFYPRFVFYNGDYWKCVGKGRYKLVRINWRAFMADMNIAAKAHKRKCESRRNKGGND